MVALHVSFPLHSEKTSLLLECIQEEITRRGWAKGSERFLADYAKTLVMSGLDVGCINKKLSEALDIKSHGFSSYDYHFADWLLVKAKDIDKTALPLRPQVEHDSLQSNYQYDDATIRSNSVRQTVPPSPPASEHAQDASKASGAPTKSKRNGPPTGPRRWNEDIDLTFLETSGRLVVDGAYQAQTGTLTGKGRGSYESAHSMTNNGTVQRLESKALGADGVSSADEGVSARNLRSGKQASRGSRGGGNYGMGSRHGDGYVRGRGGRGDWSGGAYGQHNVVELTPAVDTPSNVPVSQGQMICKFGGACQDPSCGSAHPGPASAFGTGVILNYSFCPSRSTCENEDCDMVHPSPAKFSSAS